MDWFLYDRDLRHGRDKWMLKPQAYLEPYQTSNLELFMEIINS